MPDFTKRVQTQLSLPGAVVSSLAATQTGTFGDGSAVGCAVAKSQKPDRLAAAIAAALN